MPGGTQRIAKYIAENSEFSRRKAGELVRGGKVSVNGKMTTDQSLQVSSADALTVLGRPLSQSPAKKYYIALNKPRGYVSTNSDPHAEKKAVDLIRLAGMPRLFSAGRLDKESEGLLLFSNDGDFVAKLTHPGGGVRKRYEVDIEPPLSKEEMSRLRRGVVDAGERLRAERLEPLGGNWFLFVLGEGRKREIRRMVSYCGKTVVRLKRIAYGSLLLGDLAEGEFRVLSREEAVLAAKNPEKD